MKTNKRKLNKKRIVIFILFIVLIIYLYINFVNNLSIFSDISQNLDISLPLQRKIIIKKHILNINKMVIHLGVTKNIGVAQCLKTDVV